jgi:hypothetical protein
MTRPPRPRFIVRPHLHLAPHDRIECPRGHTIRTNAGGMSHDTYVCQERTERGGGECGLRVYVIRWPDGRKYVAEVTPAEAIYMRDQHFTAAQALDFLSSAPPRDRVA